MRNPTFRSLKTLYDYLKSYAKLIKKDTRQAFAKEVKTSMNKKGFNVDSIKLSDTPQKVIKKAVYSNYSIIKTKNKTKKKKILELYAKYKIVINVITTLIGIAALYGVQKYSRKKNMGVSTEKTVQNCFFCRYLLNI